MKVLLALVTVIAVYTTDGRSDRETANEDQNYHEELNGQDEAEHFQDGSDGNNYDVIEDSTEQVRLMKERTLLTDDDQVFADPVKIATQGSNLEEIEEQHKLKLRKTKPKCKANIACLVMGGFCVTNTSLCSGRLVPEGCKKRNCQCCVPGTIEDMFDKLKKELQSLTINMNNSNSNLNSELQSLKVDMKNSNSNLNSVLQSLKADMNNSNSNLNSELQSLKVNMNNSNSNLNSELQSLKVDMNNSNSNLNSELQSLKVDMKNSNSNLNSVLQSLKVDMNNSNSNINSELQSLKVDMNNSNSNLNSELQSLKVDMKNSNSNLSSDLQSLIINTNKMNTSLNSKLGFLLHNQACPNGLFRLNTSNQCFKFFTNSSMSWTAAKEKCNSEGLALAKPENPVELRRYLVLNYGSKGAWLGGRGTGSTVNWDRDGTTLSSNNSAWYPGHPSGRTSSSYCLGLMSDTSHMNRYPNNPYYMNGCTASWYPLCELIMG